MSNPIIVALTRDRKVAPVIASFAVKVGHMAMHYFWGAFASGWNGAMTAVHGYIAMCVGSSIDPDHISAPSIHTVAFFFGVRFVIDAVGYFKAHPLPENLNLPAPPDVPEITATPTASPKTGNTVPPIPL